MGALAALALVLAPATAAAQPAANPFERGPDPTTQSIEASRGPYATEDIEVSDLRTPGFGSAVVTYPTTTADGTFGAVAIVPGYTANAEERAYLELNGASHFAPNSPNTTIARYSIAWLKRFVDDDTRYTQFLCPAPRTGTALSDVRTSCPIDESQA